MSKISIQTIDDEDGEDVRRMMRDFYISHEPLCVNFNVIGDPQTLSEYEQYCVTNLNDGLKLKAVNGDGKIVGICINLVVREKIVRSPLDPNIASDNSLKLRKFFETMDEKSKIESFLAKHDKSLYIKYLTIDPEYRGQGIATKLLEKSRDLAERIGCSFAFVYCSSYFTGLAVKKLEFKCIYSQNYSDYRDGGEIVIKTEPPQTSFTVYVFNIN